MPMSSCASSRSASSSGALAMSSRSSSISSRDSAEKLLTKLSGFLISWAMPAVSWPSEASFSDWISRSCALRRSSSECGEFARARLHLLEQPGVLDRDHGLIGEGLQDFDLALREMARLQTRHDERAFDRVVSQQRHAEQGARLDRRGTAAARRIPRLRGDREWLRSRPDSITRPAIVPRPGVAGWSLEICHQATRFAPRRRCPDSGRPRRRGCRSSPLRASQSSTAEDTSVSNTGCRSNAERLMTFSTSAVAVCCCSASLRSRVRASTLASRVS